MIVSLHYSLYVSLLALPTYLGHNITVFSNGLVDNFLSEAGCSFSNVQFADKLKRENLRQLRTPGAGLFVMADTLLGREADAYVPFRGKAVRFTISWAVLAKRLGLNVLVALASVKDDQVAVNMDLIAPSSDSPYDLACGVFRRFDEWIGEAHLEWEEARSLDWAENLSWYPTAQKQALIRLASCDIEAARLIATLNLD